MLLDVTSFVAECSMEWMEKTKNVLVVPATFDWNDLGSWDALESVHNKREGNNVASAVTLY